MNDLLNGIPLASTEHLTGHNVYNTKIKNLLEALNRRYPNMSNNDAFIHITNLTNHVREIIAANPNMNLGEIANLISYP